MAEDHGWQIIELLRWRMYRCISCLWCRQNHMWTELAPMSAARNGPCIFFLPSEGLMLWRVITSECKAVCNIYLFIILIYIVPPLSHKVRLRAVHNSIKTNEISVLKQYKIQNAKSKPFTIDSSGSSIKCQKYTQLRKPWQKCSGLQALKNLQGAIKI